MSESYAGALTDIRAASAAGGGTALSTTLALITLPKGADQLSIEGRNFTTAVVAQVLLNPYLLVLKTTDNLATVTDYSEDAQDGSTSTDVVLSSLDTLANGDALWLGSDVPFLGVQVDVDAANANAATLAGHYWNGSALAALTVTDGSAAAGATFGQDGNITWTLPTDWVPASLRALGQSPGNVPGASLPLYWVRLSVSAALDSSTTLNSLLAINQSTAYAELVSGRVLELAVRTRQLGGVGCIQAKTDAGTANLIVNAASRGRRGFA